MASQNARLLPRQRYHLLRSGRHYDLLRLHHLRASHPSPVFAADQHPAEDCPDDRLPAWPLHHHLLHHAHGPDHHHSQDGKFYNARPLGDYRDERWRAFSPLYNMTEANAPLDLTHMHPHARATLHLLQGEDILLHQRRQPRTNQRKCQCDAGPEVRSGPRERRTLARPRQHQRHEQPKGDSGDRQQRQHSQGRGEEERRRYQGDCNSGCQGGGCGGASKRRDRKSVV